MRRTLDRSVQQEWSLPNECVRSRRTNLADEPGPERRRGRAWCPLSRLVSGWAAARVQQLGQRRRDGYQATSDAGYLRHQCRWHGAHQSHAAHQDEGPRQHRGHPCRRFSPRLVPGWQEDRVYHDPGWEPGDLSHERGWDRADPAHQQHRVGSGSEVVAGRHQDRVRE